MDFIYPISYLLSLAGLVTWFFVQGNRRLSRPASAVFLLGFLAYLLALSMASADVPYKLLILFRDLAVLAIVSQLFNIFQKNKLLSIFLAIAAGLTVYYSYFDVLRFSFPQLDTEELTADAEFILHPGTADMDEIEAIGARLGFELETAFAPVSSEMTELDEYYVINVLDNSRRTQKSVYGSLERMDGIEWIEPNEVISLDVPARSEAAVSGGNFFLNDPGLKQQWGYVPMKVDNLHRLITESGITPRKVARIAIVDSGIEADHEDLRDNYQSAGSKHDTDPNGHGTHCAGIAGAVSNNGLGVASMSPGTGFVTLSGYKVLNQHGIGTQQSVIKGIIQATDDGADVISLSLGGPTQRKKRTCIPGCDQLCA